MDKFIKLCNGKFKKVELKCEHCGDLIVDDVFRIVDSEIYCGDCFDEYYDICGECGAYIDRVDATIWNCNFYCEECLIDAQVEEFENIVNNRRETIKREAGDLLEKQGKITRVETFICGFMDGRGGWYDGEYTREMNNPKPVHDYLLTQGYEFINILEESGQFQYYVSIAVVGKLNKKQLTKLRNELKWLSV